MNNDRPLVSIIIPVYNGSNYLQKAIDSALNQTYLNCEIIVINDGSGDKGATEEIAKLYGDKICYYYKENGGVASALNFGISKMKGEYFSWLSHDDWYFQNKIQKEIDAIITSGDRTTLVQGEYEFYNMGSQTYARTDFHKFYSLDRLTNSVFTVLQLQMHACSALIHKNHFERVGLFDESLKTVQDIDMWFRLFRNQKSIFLPESLHCVRQHAEAGSNTIQCYHEETGNLYTRLIESMTYQEMEEVFGNSSAFLCRMAGFLKSYGRMEEYKDIVSIINRYYNYNSEQEDRSIAELMKYIRNLSNGKAKKIAIFGAGQYGIRIKYELSSRLINVDCFIDNNKEKQGIRIDGILCMSVGDMIKEKDNVLIIVAQRNLQPALVQLKNNRFKYLTTKQELEAKVLTILPAISRKEMWI